MDATWLLELLADPARAAGARRALYRLTRWQHAAVKLAAALAATSSDDPKLAAWAANDLREMAVPSGSADEIEFDLDPREVTDEARYDALMDFMVGLGRATGRRVVMTPESASGTAPGFVPFVRSTGRRRPPGVRRTI